VPRARRSRGTPARAGLNTQAAGAAAGQHRPIELDPEAETRAATRTIESASASWGPTEEDIRLRAYHRYLERGGGQGMDFDDWLEAERELKLRG
jgi:Protein of unknown function (DUF2934)